MLSATVVRRLEALGTISKRGKRINGLFRLLEDRVLWHEAYANIYANETYIEQILAPSLRPGQIVILDNLSIHLGFCVKQTIETRGCQLLFLPAYSPDFSPIEGPFPN